MADMDADGQCGSQDQGQGFHEKQAERTAIFGKVAVGTVFVGWCVVMHLKISFCSGISPRYEERKAWFAASSQSIPQKETDYFKHIWILASHKKTPS
jgi:hypothetical protein